MEPSATAAAGRRAPVAELRLRLSSAPAPYLEGALDNPALGSRELLLLLRNGAAPRELLLRVARERRWTAFRQVQKALALHPAAPPAMTRRYLPYLAWTDVGELTISPRVHPLTRRHAEANLLRRLDGLTLGERVALARRACRPVLDRLLATREPLVLRGSLGNTRLVEHDVAALAGDPSCGAELLVLLAHHVVWGERRSVRFELARNASLPLHEALRVVGRLAPRDLRRLVQDPTCRRLVRVRAERLLLERSPTDRVGIHRTGADERPPRGA
ncbi:MAG TPA: hypothetical protein VJS92_10565 [Candidatus Polarisedimenticolaceae bacterium]|nr:hypothetical protein [Candidatus Polarisedimenticolaceae bacterium]